MIRSRYVWRPIVLALFSSAVAPAATNEISEPFQGVRLIHSRSTVPRLVDMWIAEIDMSAPGLDFMTTPSNGPLVGDTTRQTTRAFATQVGAQLAVNANFFAGVSGDQYDVLGLSVSNGDAYSPFQSGFRDALNVTANNVATIIRGNTSGFGHTPATSLYNAVGGNRRLVTDGVNVAPDDPIHPRTAAGVTADGKLLLFTVDGRNPGHSEGLDYREMADILIRWGARDAINLDGGGSTTFVMDDPATAANDVRVMNVPSDLFPNGERGRERLNGNNFAVFASPQPGPTEKVFVFADFEQGDEGSFSTDISFSGSNRGFDTSASTADAVSGQAYDGSWSQRLTIIDDPATDGDVQNPGGAWFARHVSGGGNPANHEARPVVGSVGFWAKTSDPELRVSLVLDDASGLTGERGIAQNMIADGQWHPYFWDLTDTGQWEGWVNGDGVVDDHFTLDSIQIFGPPNVGPNLDATVYIDAVSHIVPGLVPGDFNGDFLVNAADYVVWRKGLGTGYTQDDYEMWRARFGDTAGSGSAIGHRDIVPTGSGAGTTGDVSNTAAVPEPTTIVSIAVAAWIIFLRRANFRHRTP